MGGGRGVWGAWGPGTPGIQRGLESGLGVRVGWVSFFLIKINPNPLEDPPEDAPEDPPEDPPKVPPKVPVNHRTATPKALVGW